MNVLPTVELASDGSFRLYTREELPRYTGFDEHPNHFESAYVLGQVVNYYPSNSLASKVSGCVVGAVQFSEGKVSYSLYIPQGGGYWQYHHFVDSYLVHNDAAARDYEDDLRRARIEQWVRPTVIAAEPDVAVGALSVEGRAFIDAIALTAWPYIYDCDFDDIKSWQQTFINALPFIERHQLGVAFWHRVIGAATPDFEMIEQPLIDIAIRIMNRRAKIMADRDLTKADVDFIKDWQLYFRTDSVPAMNRLRTLVGKVASAKVVELYADDLDIDVNSQRADTELVKDIVEKLTGKRKSKMGLDEVKKARVDNPDLYQSYLVARRAINATTKEAIVAITRKAGKPMLVSDLIKKLNQDGIEHSLPATFMGKVDEKGYYTMFDEPLDGVPVGTVQMNPAYKEGELQWVFKTQAEGAQTWQWIFTKAAKTARKTDKFKRVGEAVKDIAKYQKLWRADMFAKDEERQELGVLAEILFQTSTRIGSVGNATAGQATFGLTTLVGANFTFKSNAVRITYVAKKLGAFDYVITGTDKYTKRVIELLRVWVKAAGKKNEVFSMSNKDVNAYLRTRLKLPVTSHGFRHMRGTSLMLDLLNKAKPQLGENPTEKEVLKAFNAAAEQVGEVLGHTNKRADGSTQVTGATAVKSYIDPGVSRGFFDDYNIRPPAALEKL